MGPGLQFLISSRARWDRGAQRNAHAISLPSISVNFGNIRQYQPSHSDSVGVCGDFQIVVTSKVLEVVLEVRYEPVRLYLGITISMRCRAMV